MTNRIMQDIYKYLGRGTTGKQIGKQARAGDRLCKSLITCYKMHCVAPGDPGIQAVLTEVVEEYVRKEKARLGAWPAEAPLSLRHTYHS